MKKGISALIASILILGFTVAVTATVIVWAQSFAEKRIQETEEKMTLFSCNDISFELVSVSLDSETKTITATVDSRGKAFNGFAVQGTCNSGSFTGKSDQVFNPLDKITFDIATIGDCTELKEIKFVPFIKVKESIQLCNGKEQTWVME